MAESKVVGNQLVVDIIVDTRESKAWTFQGTLPTKFTVGELVQEKLDAGDYSIRGYSEPSLNRPSIIVERKNSVEELMQNVTKHWKRFQRELAKLTLFTEKQIIVEDDCSSIWPKYKNRHYRYLNQSPYFLFKRLAQIKLDYDVSVVFMSNRANAQYYVAQYFKYFVERHGLPDDRNDT